MRGILINAISKTVVEVELPNIDYTREEPSYKANMAEMYRLLDTNIVEIVGLGPIGLWVDEEGLLRENPGPFFRIGKPGVYGPIISKKGLLLGTGGPEGDPSDFPFSQAKVASLLEWLPEGTKFVEIETREGMTNHPILDQMPVINQVSIFQTPDGKRIEQ